MCYISGEVAGEWWPGTARDMCSVVLPEAGYKNQAPTEE